MSELFIIIVAGFLMASIALMGGLLVMLNEGKLDQMLMPLVAFAAGSLLGGAFFHMIPVSLKMIADHQFVFICVICGFITFYILEQFIHWRHSHRVSNPSLPLSLPILILLADALHNLIGGMSIGAIFMLDVSLGKKAWLAAALHELPQELGDFAILVYGGYTRKKALLLNFISGLTFLLGGIIAYYLSNRIDVALLVPFAAGNFIYIAAADLIPEIKKSVSLRLSLLHFIAFMFGLWLMLVLV